MGGYSYQATGRGAGGGLQVRSSSALLRTAFGLGRGGYTLRQFRNLLQIEEGVLREGKDGGFTRTPLQIPVACGGGALGLPNCCSLEVPFWKGGATQII